MKYLLLVLMLALVGCGNGKPWPETKKFTALSCDKYGCDTLTEFKDEAECRDLLYAVMNLHKLMKDKPSRVLRCIEK